MTSKISPMATSLPEVKTESDAGSIQVGAKDDLSANGGAKVEPAAVEAGRESIHSGKVPVRPAMRRLTGTAYKLRETRMGSVLCANVEQNNQLYSQLRQVQLHGPLHDLLFRTPFDDMVGESLAKAIAGTNSSELVDLILGLQRSQTNLVELLKCTSGSHKSVEGYASDVVSTIERLVADSLVSLYVVNITKRCLIDPSLGKSYSLDQGLTGRCAKFGEKFNLDDARRSAVFDPVVDAEERDPTAKNLVLLPVVDKQSKEVLAVIKAVRSGEKFSGDEVSMIQAIGHAVCGQLIRIMLLDEQNTQQKRTMFLLNAIRSISAETGTKDVVRRLMKTINELLPHGEPFVYMMASDKLHLVSVEHDFKFRVARGICGAVARTGKLFRAEDVQSEPVFDPDVDTPREFKGRAEHIMCAPIKYPNGSVTAVVEVVSTDAPFSTDDSMLLAIVADGAGITLKNSQLLESVKKAGIKSRAMVEVVKMVNKNRNTAIETLVQNLVGVAYRLIEAEKISLFLVDMVKNELWCKVSTDIAGFRVPIGKGISGTVALTGNTMNIPDAYADSRFDQSFDKETGFVTRNILCLAVKDRAGRVVAVLQAINKIGGASFDAEDEQMMISYASEIAPVIVDKALETAYSKALDQGAIEEKTLLRQYVDNRPGLLSSRKLKRGFSASLRALDLTDDMAIIKSWSFDVLEYEERALRSFAKSILGEFDLPQQCKLTEKAIQFFIRSVAHGYRDENPFHNYKHGMQVMHGVFMMLEHSPQFVKNMLNHVDMLACLVGAVAHDIGHTGTNNNFETAIGSEIAITYNDISVLESMHASTLFRILNEGKAGGADLLVGLSGMERVQFRSLVISGILATDMKHHQQITERTKRAGNERAQSGGDLSSSGIDSEFLVGLFIHSCDLSNPALPNFSVASRWALMCCEEFTNIVTQEKERGMKVTAFMDHLDTEKNIAQLQMNFVDYVVTPLWAAVGELLPTLAMFAENCKENRAKWERVHKGETLEDVRREDRAYTPLTDADAAEQKRRASAAFDEALVLQKEVTSVSDDTDLGI